VAKACEVDPCNVGYTIELRINLIAGAMKKLLLLLI